MTATQRVDVARLSELLDLATPGPWTTGEGDPQSILSEHNWTCIAQANTVFVDTADANAALIVAAVNALPALLQQIAELERDNETMRGADYHQAGVEQEQEIIDLESKLAERDAEIELERSRREHTQQWYAERLVKIKEIAKREGLWNEVAAVIANGSGTRQLPDGSYFYDPPTYAQQLNSAKHRAEAAERAREGDRAELAKFERECRICQGQHERAYADHQMDGRESYHPGRALANTFKWMGDRIAAFLAANGGRDEA